MCAGRLANQVDAVLPVSREPRLPRRRFATGACRAINSATQSTHTRSFAAVGVTWLCGFQFEIKAIARLPASVDEVR